MHLDSNIITAPALFTIFGLYGEVSQVKVMFKKKDSALIEMVDPQGSINARTHLNGVAVFGTKWSVTVSKNQNIKPAVTGDELCASPATHQKSKFNPKNVVAPCERLIVTGLLPEVTEDILLHYFKQYGSVTSCEFMHTTRAAVVEMADLDVAMTCLIALNNYSLQLDGNRSCVLSLNFCKNPAAFRGGSAPY
eukprot:TRINITY_DN1111_c0_g1_i2.p2 TRINITY_DN1111_c0_g1~~TRINITY_DN1111_c0_g1_i2.p2  ORF type:complete len:193 (+),score=35.88 TRINITY_DN1111_c0_g1_i2:1153-1731(+)